MLFCSFSASIFAKPNVEFCEIPGLTMNPHFYQPILQFCQRFGDCGNDIKYLVDVSSRGQ